MLNGSASPVRALPRPDASPLWAVMLFVGLNSLGTGAATNGVFFLTKSAYGFGVGLNYALGLVFGGAYIACALLVGPALRRLAARSSRVTSRGVLGAIMLVLAAGCVLPALVHDADDPRSGAWAVWIFAVLYAGASGALWPIVESFLSGGRSGRELSSAVGIFNITWGGAVFVAFWGMAPFVEPYPLQVLVGMGVIHVGAAAILRWFRPEPGRERHERHPHPPVYERLLRASRAMLATGYVLLYALTPFLPTATERLGLAAAWQTPATSTWSAARLAGFALLQRWHGWHGRWSALIISSTLLVVGFGGAFVASSPAAIDRLGAPAALAALLVSLAMFGLGFATIYTAALYYAMEVGHAEVDAGGAHEALVGMGYAVGPMCGLGAVWISGAGRTGSGSVESAMLAISGVVALAGIVVAVVLGMRGRPEAGRSPATSAGGTADRSGV